LLDVFMGAKPLLYKDAVLYVRTDHRELTLRMTIEAEGSLSEETDVPAPPAHRETDPDALVQEQDREIRRSRRGVAPGSVVHAAGSDPLPAKHELDIQYSPRRR
jgi:hypothetical protein